ncbi:MAG: hypothetical protein Q8P53_04325 [Candidatus Shapirobacteria bacterium]|nr:hypothetical protein [Candidatus Shapirobacteria bacterium]
MITLGSFSQIQSMYRYLRSQKENRRFIKSVEITSTFTLIIIFSIFAIRPTFLTISSLIGEIKSKEALSVKMRAKINKIIIAQSSFSQVQGDYDLIESSLPNYPKYYKSYGHFIGAAQAATSSFGKINFNLLSNSEKPVGLESYAVNFTLKNEYLPLINFLNYLSESRRVMEINDIKVERVDTKSEGNVVSSANNLNLNFTTQLFYEGNQR